MKTLVIKDLKKKYGKVQAVNGISLGIEKGEVFGFLGPNGAGKTTTIRCILDFIRPSGGSITILGKDSVKDSVSIKKEIGFLSGDVRLYDNWTGEDHISLVAGVRGGAKIADELVGRFGFNPKIRAKNLSSGNKQKLGLILALMHEPKVLILDEPTVGLDPLLQNTLYEILNEFRSKGTTIFMSSHYLREVEVVCDRVAIIKDGVVVATESINNLKRMKLHRVTASFDQPVKNDFADEVATISADNKTIELKVKGDINQIVKKLSRYKLHDLEIERASLEEIFLEFYRDKDKS